MDNNNDDFEMHIDLFGHVYTGRAAIALVVLFIVSVFFAGFIVGIRNA